MAGINPKRQAGRVSKQRLDKLVVAIKQVLADAITQGGTTLRNFVDSDGNPGYFKQQLRVYGRAQQPCRTCSKQGRRVRGVGEGSPLQYAVQLYAISTQKKKYP